MYQPVQGFNHLFHWKTQISLITLLLIAGCASTPKHSHRQFSKQLKINYVGEVSGSFGGLKLSRPGALTLDPAGNLYILDEGNNRIVKLRSDYIYINATGGYGSEMLALNHPTDIVADGGINFFILDEGNKRIVRTDYNLVYVDVISFNDNPDLINLGVVQALAYSASGRLYLADPDNSRVVVLDQDYAIEQELLPPGGFSFCSSLAVGPDDYLYVYDRLENSIFRFDPFGNSEGRILLVTDVEISDFVVLDDFIVATGNKSGQLIIFDFNGNVLASTTVAGNPLTRLNSPGGIAVRFDGRLFMCDSGNNRIACYEILSR